MNLYKHLIFIDVLVLGLSISYTSLISFFRMVVSGLKSDWLQQTRMLQGHTMNQNHVGLFTKMHSSVTLQNFELCGFQLASSSTVISHFSCYIVRAWMCQFSISQNTWFVRKWRKVTRQAIHQCWWFPHLRGNALQRSECQLLCCNKWTLCSDTLILYTFTM